MASDLSADEATFLNRALPHFLAGKSVEESLRAVLDDDARLLQSVCYDRHPIWAGDILGEQPLGGQRERGLVSAISAEVYSAFRAGQSA